MIVLGVDPAQSSGYSVLRDRKLCAVGTVAEVSVTKRLEEIGAIVAAVLEMEPKNETPMLAIETQYLGKNPKSLIRLVELRMQWEITARTIAYGTDRRIEIQRVNPSEWQSRLLPKSRSGGRRERTEGKAMAREIVRGVIGETADGMTEDEVDSVCVGLFVAGFDPNKLPGIG